MGKNKFNVLFICSWYPSDEHPSLGNFIEKHAVAVSLYNDVTVIAAIESGKDLMTVKENSGVTEIIVYYKKALPIINYLSALKKAYSKAIELKHKFDIAHINVTYPAGLQTFFLKIPYVITEHYTGFLPSSSYHWSFWKERAAKAIMDKAELILPVSKNLGKSIQSSFSLTPYIKISNVVDTDIFYPPEKLPEAFTFLHISSLNEKTKNITGLLKALSILEDRNIDFRLLIGGDGNIRDLQKKITQSGLPSSKIKTFGSKTTKEVAELMRNAHCLVLASHVENQPCVILEALCTGMPVISTDVGGISEEITKKNGVLVPPGNPKKLAKALENILDSYPQYDREKIASRAAKKYSYKAVAKKVTKIYSNVLNANP